MTILKPDPELPGVVTIQASSHPRLPISMMAGDQEVLALVPPNPAYTKKQFNSFKQLSYGAKHSSVF